MNKWKIDCIFFVPLLVTGLSCFDDISLLMLDGIELTAKFKCNSSYKEFLRLVLIKAIAYFFKP